MPKKSKLTHDNNNGKLKKKSIKQNTDKKISENPEELENNDILQTQEFSDIKNNNFNNSKKNRKKGEIEQETIENTKNINSKKNTSKKTDEDEFQEEEFSLDDLEMEDIYELDLEEEDSTDDMFSENEEYLVSEDDLVLCPNCGEIIEIERLKRLEECPSCGLPITEFENFEEYLKILIIQNKFKKINKILINYKKECNFKWILILQLF